MTVKADSKGRLTGAYPGKEYVREEDADGTITFTPEVPEVFDQERSVTWEQFTEFFGMSPDQMVRTSLKPATLSGVPGHIPNGLVAKRFVTTPDGKRVYVDGDSLKETVFIRIRKKEEE